MKKKATEGLGIFAVGLGQGFYLILLSILSLPQYLRYPKLIIIDGILFYYYNTAFSGSKSQKEKSETNRPFPDLTDGDTPYVTLSQAFRYIPIRPKSVFVDLGCGKGKIVLFVALKYGIRSIGIDVMPTYIKVATYLAKKFKIKKAEFIEANFLEMALDKGSIFYVTPTCFSKESKKELLFKLGNLRKNTIVISSTFPIKHPSFKVKKKLKVLYSWGKGQLYIQKKTI